MTDAEKTARRAVREYLAALEDSKPRRGRKRTPESIDKRLVKISVDLDAASPLKKLEMAQERIELLNEKERLESTVDVAALEAAFVANAQQYGKAKGITFAAWREVGVSANTLQAAGITRGS